MRQSLIFSQVKKATPQELTIRLNALLLAVDQSSQICSIRQLVADAFVSSLKSNLKTLIISLIYQKAELFCHKLNF